MERKKPCQYDAKMIPLTQRNLGTGRNGFRSCDIHTQNKAKAYRHTVMLMLYIRPLQKYPDDNPIYPSWYVFVAFITMVAIARRGFNQIYCKIPRFMARNVYGSEMSTLGKQ
jgi:hypothetical protein